MTQQEYIESKRAELIRQTSAKDPEYVDRAIKQLEASGIKIPQDSWNILPEGIICLIRAMGYGLKSDIEYIDDVAIVRYEASKVFITFGAKTLHDLFNMIWRFEQL